MDDELDETITVPRHPLMGPLLSPLGDLEDTAVPGATVPRVTAAPPPPPPPLVEPATGVPAWDGPPPLVEPITMYPREQASGIELTAEKSDEDVSTKPFARGEYDEATFNPQLFYRFRIGRTVVWLDAVAYVGRRPSSPRIIYGQMPRLVRVPSPKQEVSSTHIELRQLGASVVLTDLRSTNGSTVFSPTGEPRKLRQGESVVATPGTLVDIGDGNIIEILPLQARSQSEPASPVDPTEGLQ